MNCNFYASHYITCLPSTTYCLDHRQLLCSSYQLLINCSTTGGHNCVRFIIMSDFYWSLFLKCYNQNFEYFFLKYPFEIDFIS